jgi:signal peptidase I
VIGLPGETLEIRDGVVIVDGHVLDEPYVFDGQPTIVIDEPARWVIPAGHFFVAGDHRTASADSRAFGPIARATVVGRAWIRYWPLDEFGILPTPVFPPPVGNGDVRLSPAVP